MKTFTILKMIHKLPNGDSYTIGVSDEFLEGHYKLPNGSLKTCTFGLIFTTMLHGNPNSENEIDRYPCIIVPESFGFIITKEEVQQLIEHELGHLYVPGASGIESDPELSDIKEILADSYVSNPTVMISLIQKMNNAIQESETPNNFKKICQMSFSKRIEKLKKLL